MTRQLPGYLAMTDVRSHSIRYAWEDGTFLTLVNSLDDGLVERLGKLQIRAMLAYAIGSAEWLVHRFTPLLRDQAPWLFLEAAWAKVVHGYYSDMGDSTSWGAYADADDWAGAIKEPVRFALIGVESMIDEVQWRGLASPGGYVRYAANAAAETDKLTRYVLDDPSDYHQWSEHAIRRLTELYPLVEGDEVGDVVPPEAIDPSEPFAPRQTEELVNAYLAGLDHWSNRFLSPPAAMNETHEGEPPFEGTPYVFDIEADQARRRWMRQQSLDGCGHLVYPAATPPA